MVCVAATSFLQTTSRANALKCVTRTHFLSCALSQVGIFARRDIKVGEEFTFDYQMDDGAEMKKCRSVFLHMTETVRSDPASMTFKRDGRRCKARNCRGFLGKKEGDSDSNSD